ncbi:sugar ABC transporter substrate-binding protein [Phytoactinopolyspora alkaliphila]|uniref:Sugar ABC transporter substrate-binding protein n=1 Tax=Phytoactinopolyspora alkaliphila TaxID=1783498 RepID=A0A6N9YR82_9ACTN|nr:sugar ABC transporter substrate-binding protein [Phytoactinopolyspora alkaliphila]NED97440.1 sugar ABC transporter substrate-binding protein [Phytoactinopolyspora alkaliphila]
MSKRTLRPLRTATMTAGIALICLACGTSPDAQTATGDTSGEDVARFQAVAEAAMEPATTFTGPAEGPPAEPDKRIVWISCGLAAEGCNLPAEGAKEAAEALGWEIKIEDGQFSPSSYSQAIQEAIDQGVDGIVLNAISSEAVAEPVRRARQAGIVVGSFDSANTPSDDGVSFEVNAQNAAQGEALASYLIWQSGGEARPFLLFAPEFKAVTEWLGAAKETFESCSSCQIVDERTMVASDAATSVPQVLINAKRQNPGMNVLVGPYDAALLQAVPSLEAAGVTSDLMIGSFNAISPTVQYIRDGLSEATVGPAMRWGAWAAMDNMNRVFAGQEPVEQNVPFRLITSQNVDSLPADQPWDGDTDYRSSYQELWLVEADE